jgi:hypothetical protein
MSDRYIEMRNERKLQKDKFNFPDCEHLKKSIALILSLKISVHSESVFHTPSSSFCQVQCPKFDALHII